MQEKKIIIAIDGYSSCGKSTMARQLAALLGYNHIDSGAIYRAITLYFLRNSIDFSDPDARIKAMANINISFLFNTNSKTTDVLLNDEDVSSQIREMLVSEKVSEVAAIREVRAFAVAQQKRMGRKKGIVMDGRDIGTVVFPEAELKIFMTAEPDVRIKRRFEELYPTNHHISFEEVRKNIELRDYLDTTRTESPLVKAADAVVLDNSNLTREEQLDKVLGWVKDKLATETVQ